MLRGRDRSRGATRSRVSVARGFNPRSIASLAAWYRADQGYAAAQWNDLSGNAAHLLQATGGKQFTGVAADAGYNGQQVVSTGAGGVMAATFAASLPGPYTVYVVGEASSDLTSARILVDGLDVSSRPLLYDEITSGAGTMILPPSGSIVGAALTSKRAICGVFQGAGSGFYVNNITTPVGTANIPAVLLPGHTAGASFNQASGFLLGKLAEIIWYGAAHSAAQRGQVMRYLAARYAITVAP